MNFNDTAQIRAEDYKPFCELVRLKKWVVTPNGYHVGTAGVIMPKLSPPNKRQFNQYWWEDAKTSAQIPLECLYVHRLEGSPRVFYLLPDRKPKQVGHYISQPVTVRELRKLHPKWYESRIAAPMKSIEF